MGEADKLILLFSLKRVFLANFSRMTTGEKKKGEKAFHPLILTDREMRGIHIFLFL